MKKYELIFSEENKIGCFRVSLVKDPAVEATLIKFSSDEKPLFFVNEEKRIIYSVAIRPNKLIFRSHVPAGDLSAPPAYVYYTPETVERLQQNYFRQQGNKGTNIQHEDKNTEGIYPIESWIVSDPETDKSKAIGLETMAGDWVMAFKIDNDDVWQQVKEGNLDGLSVEAYLGYKESNINFNNENPMNWKSLFKSFFGSDAVEIAPGYWAKDSEVGTVVLDKDGNTAANAEFKVGDKTIKTDADGKILASEEQQDDMTIEQAMALIAELEAKLADSEKEKAEAEAEKTKAEAEAEKMSSEKTAVEKKLTEKTAEFEKFKKEKSPAPAKVDNVPPVDTPKPYEKMSNYEKMKFNRENKA